MNSALHTRPAPRVIFDRETAPPSRDGVTVAVSARNYARYVLEALDSVAQQTHPALDLIVVDDGSEDESVARVGEWMARAAGRFGRTLLLVHDRSYGVAQARNTAFEHAKHDTIFVLDADNAIYPAAIARLRAACDHAGAAAAYSQIERFGDEQGVGLAGVWDPARFAVANYVDAMALIRRDAWLAVGGYSTFDVAGREDWDLWCKFVEHGLEGVFVPQILCRYRVHGRSMSRTELESAASAAHTEIALRHPWLRS